MLAQQEQQLVATLVQPGVVAVEGAEAGQQPRQRRTGLERFLALVQVEKAIHIRTAAQAAGIGADLHGLVAVDPKIRQDELRPVLVEVAEEHQAQAIAQVHDRQAQQSILQLRAPLAECPGLGIGLLQHPQPLLLPGLGRQGLVLEAQLDLGLAQQAEQFFQGQWRLVVDPAQVEQWRQGPGRIADLRIAQPGLAKMPPLAHHHAHQQCLCRLPERGEIDDEALLFAAQHIGIALLQPAQHLPEVMQVVKGVLEGVGGHGRKAPRQVYTGYAYR